MARRVTLVFLVVSAGAYLALGLRFLLDPAGGARDLGVAPLGPSGMSSIRALPGGLQGSVGILVALTLVRRRSGGLRAPLEVVLVVSLGFLAGRTLSVLLDGPPGGFIWFATALEVMGAAGALILLPMQKRGA